MNDFFASTDADIIDIDRAASAFPDISLDGGIITQGPPASLHVSSPYAASAFPHISLDGGITQGPPDPLHVSSPYAPRPQPNSYTPSHILTHPSLSEVTEPDVIMEWRKKQAQEIQARRDASMVKRQETISKAERAIDAFYEDYTTKRTKIISENKEEELAYLNQLTQSFSTGTTWSRICELVDLHNSQSKTAARTGHGMNLDRFKEVLLRLRREGESAPAAGGY